MAGMGGSGSPFAAGMVRGGGGITGGGLSQPKAPKPPKPPKLLQPKQIAGAGAPFRPGGVGAPYQAVSTLPAPQGVTAGQNASGVTKPAAATTTQASPLDSTYYANTAANTFKVNNSVNSLNLANSQAGTALQAALAQLAYAQPRQQLALEQKANTNGSLYSSVYDQNLGNLNYQYAGKQGGDIDSYTNKVGANDAKIAALEGSIPLYNDQQAVDSATRAAQAAAKNPATGNGTNTTTSGSTARTSRSRTTTRTRGTGAQFNASGQSQTSGRGAAYTSAAQGRLISALNQMAKGGKKPPGWKGDRGASLRVTGRPSPSRITPVAATRPMTAPNWNP